VFGVDVQSTFSYVVVRKHALVVGRGVVLAALCTAPARAVSAMLALAGGLVAALPWTPRIGIEPHLAWRCFAPAVMDTAFDMPPR